MLILSFKLGIMCPSMSGIHIFFMFWILCSSYSERYELTTSPAILVPSALMLNGRNTYSAETCKLSRYLWPYKVVHVTEPINTSLRYSSDKCHICCPSVLFCRPKVNYPTYRLPTVKDNQKSEWLQQRCLFFCLLFCLLSYTCQPYHCVVRSVDLWPAHAECHLVPL